MHRMDARLDHLSLRDVRLLATWLGTLSVTRTGEALGLSQPATSRIVAKLRRVLNDPLVVRTAQGAALTPRACALVGDIDAAMAAVDRAFATVGFDPRTATCTIRIATTDYGATVLVAPLAVHLSKVAPGVGLEVVSYSPETFASIARGEVDMALYADAPLPPDFHALDLFKESYAYVLRDDHPALNSDSRTLRPLTNLAGYPRAAMLYPEGHRMLRDDVIAEQAGSAVPPANFATPYFLSLGPLISASETVACLPSRAARQLAQANHLVCVPIKESPRFAYRLIWHARTHGDARQQWLRAEITAIAMNERG